MLLGLTQGTASLVDPLVHVGGDQVADGVGPCGREQSYRLFPVQIGVAGHVWTRYCSGCSFTMPVHCQQTHACRWTWALSRGSQQQPQAWTHDSGTAVVPRCTCSNTLSIMAWLARKPQDTPSAMQSGPKALYHLPRPACCSLTIALICQLTV